MIDKAEKKLIEKGSQAIVDKFSNFRKLWGGVQMLSAKFIREHQEGKINPQKVNAIADAVDKAMKGMRLLEGQSTENVSTNWHMEIVNAVKDKEAGKNDGDTNSDGSDLILGEHHPDGTKQEDGRNPFTP
jgi:hypothetical protein